MAVIAQALASNQNPSELFEEYIGEPIPPLQKIILNILGIWSYKKWIGEVSEDEGLAGTIKQEWRHKELEYKARQAKHTQMRAKTHGKDRDRYRR